MFRVAMSSWGWGLVVGAVAAGCTGSLDLGTTPSGAEQDAGDAESVGVSLLSFTPVDEPNGITDLVLNGTGFAAGQPATVVFSGAVGLVIPGANVTATMIKIPMASIPDTAVAGSTSVTTAGHTLALHVTPPAKISSVNGVAADADAGTISIVDAEVRLTIQGFRLSASTHVILARPTRIIHDASSFTGYHESISDTQIVCNVAVVAGISQLRVKTDGGTVMFAIEIFTT